MAFFSKARSILGQTVTKHLNSGISASNPSILQTIRCMSSSKLFVGGISYSTDETSLGEEFSKYGQVTEARIIMDRESGRSRGFGFVTFASSEEASAACQALDGKELHSRIIRVNYAHERAPRNFGSSGYSGGGGEGYGGGGYGSGGGGGGYGGGGGDSGYGGGPVDDYSGGGSSAGKSYRGNGVGYMSGNYGGAGGTGSYGSGGGNAAGFADAGNYASGNSNGSGYENYGGDAGADSSFSSSGIGGPLPDPLYGSGDQFGGESGNMADAPGGFDDDEPDDYANRQA